MTIQIFKARHSVRAIQGTFNCEGDRFLFDERQPALVKWLKSHNQY